LSFAGIDDDRYDDLGGKARRRAMTQVSTTPPNPILAGLAGRCPQCGKGKMFAGFLGLKPACEACGLDYSFADAGDGPAVFVILFAGFVVVGAALVTEMLYQPPIWLHAVLWLPLILITTILPLRLMKGVLIALQYHHKAAEGRLERRGDA
jgi:uncharacterized protein (DUF983 family)